MSQFQSLRQYEHFVYTLSQQFPSIQNSSLMVVRRGRFFAEVTGELLFTGSVRLSVYERLVWNGEGLMIEGYSYDVWEANEKLFWYDSQPHPNNPELAVSHPHHKHVPPDIRHNRIPAPMLSFTEPNLPKLIREIELIYESARVTDFHD